MQVVVGLSRYNLNVNGYDLNARVVPDSDGVHGAGVACGQQRNTLGSLRLDEDREPLSVEVERLGRPLYAVSEPYAEIAVDANAEPCDDPLVETRHSATSLRGRGRSGPDPSPRA